MPIIDPYWISNRDAPYATFLAVIHNYTHPETEDLPALQRATKRQDLPRMTTFKTQFREVLADPSVLPEDALFTAAEFDDDTDKAFLKRLWHELYGDEKPNPSD